MASEELERDDYDVIVIGTGLAESIAAAALAKAGETVLHLDPNEYYAAQQASLTLDELVAWSSTHYDPSSSSSTSSDTRLYSSASTSRLTPELDSNRRRYALSLFPAVLPSRGSLIDTLIQSDVSKYVSFRMLDSVSIWRDNLDGQDGVGGVQRVPSSKEEVFKDKSASLVEKRRLMKFLLFAAGDFEEDELLKGKEDQPLIRFLEESFSLPKHLSTSVAYAISHCTSATDPTMAALQRTRRYLRSVGRYGSGAFLVGQYGGAGEVAQGFCRACAVFGGTYVLGPSAKATSIDIRGNSVKLELPCHPRPVTAKHLLASPDHLPAGTRPALGPTGSEARCIAILGSIPQALRRAPKTQATEAMEGEAQDEDEEKLGEDDTAIVVFPSEGERTAAVRALMMGEGTGSCPAGQFVLYLSTQISDSQDPEEILQPFLHSLSPQPLFESYHIVHSSPMTVEPGASPVIVLSPYAGDAVLTEGLDWEAEEGKKAYLAAMGEGEGIRGFFEKTEEELNNEAGQDEL